MPFPPRRKVSKAYFALLEVLCHSHTATIANTDAATFNYILTSLEQVRGDGRGGGGGGECRGGGGRQQAETYVLIYIYIPHMKLHPHEPGAGRGGWKGKGRGREGPPPFSSLTSCSLSVCPMP